MDDEDLHFRDTRLEATPTSAHLRRHFRDLCARRHSRYRAPACAIRAGQAAKRSLAPPPRPRRPLPLLAGDYDSRAM